MNLARLSFAASISFNILNLTNAAMIVYKNEQINEIMNERKKLMIFSIHEFIESSFTCFSQLHYI